MKSKIGTLSTWLDCITSNNAVANYSHLWLKENGPLPDDTLMELRGYFNEALAPAKEHYRCLVLDTLHPLASTGSADPVAGFPEKLPHNILMEYFGEIFLGVIIEHYKIFGSDLWEIPAYLFHTHNVVFHALEVAKQTGDEIGTLTGRTGDDCLAFERDDGGSIRRIIFGEAKCLANHSAAKISELHQQLNTTNMIPGDLLRVIEALRSSSNGDADEWIAPLQECYLGKVVERCDLGGYLVGNKPSRSETWISRSTPHKYYSQDRELTIAEGHFTKILGYVEDILKENGSAA